MSLSFRTLWPCATGNSHSARHAPLIDQALTVLVVDDDPNIRRSLRRTLRYHGYNVLAAADGERGLQLAAEQRPDLVILDWILPGLDGLVVAQRLKAADGVPILMITGRDRVGDRVKGLDAGVDDYLIKPFATQELLARLRALLRRGEPPTETTQLTFMDLALDPEQPEARRGGRSIPLSPREYDLLTYLLRNPRRVVTKARLLVDVWGIEDESQDNVVEVYISYLRTKLEAEGEARLIQTVRGVGYILREE